MQKAMNTIKENSFLVFGVVFMALSVGLACCDFQTIKNEKENFLWWSWTVKKTYDSSVMSPVLSSTLFAVIIYMGLVLRRIVSFNASKGVNLFLKLGLMGLNVLFIASFLGVFLNGSVKIWGFPEINGQVLLIISILLTWLGMKTIAGYVWIVLFILAIGSMKECSNAMGAWGCVYILSAFFSIFFQLLSSEMSMSGFFNAFVNDFKRGVVPVKKDVLASVEATKKGAAQLTKTVAEVGVKTAIGV